MSAVEKRRSTPCGSVRRDTGEERTLIWTSVGHYVGFLVVERRAFRSFVARLHACLHADVCDSVLMRVHAPGWCSHPPSAARAPPRDSRRWPRHLAAQITYRSSPVHVQGI